MHAGADLEPEHPDGAHDLDRASGGRRGPLEGREEPVAGGAHLPPAMPREHRPNRVVVSLQRSLPRDVTELGRSIGRRLDVREQHRRQPATRHDGMPLELAEERGDRVHHRLGGLSRDPVILARKHYQPGIADPLGRRCQELDGHQAVALTVHHQRRHADGGQHLPDVQPEAHLHQRTDGPRADARALDPADPLQERRITGSRRVHLARIAQRDFPRSPAGRGPLDVVLPTGTVFLPDVGPRRVQDQPAHAIGVGGCEQHGDLTPLGEPEHHRPGRTGVVEDHAEILCEHLGGREILRGEAIGEPDAPPVDRDHAPELAETLAPIRLDGIVP